MGIYINPGNEGFATARRKKYVDKSGLITLINDDLESSEKLFCVSRPRRFGKSFAAKMLCAYYSCGCDSATLFDDLKIASSADYREHLNKYNVLLLDITSFISRAGVANVVESIEETVCAELRKEFPDTEAVSALCDYLANVVASTGRKFVAIIDEWDAPVRARNTSADAQYTYLEFLRSLFKNTSITDKVFAAAYMTGILPIKKDGSQSAISEFREYSMLQARKFAPYVGFSEEEVKDVCNEYDVAFSKMKQWYDGYSLNDNVSVYNPYSVMLAAQNDDFISYWRMSSAADSLLTYINMDYDGLSKAVTELIAGVSIPVNTRSFKNDLSSFGSRDDVLTLLIHFGYLSYDAETEKVRIPNEEIRMEFSDAIRKVTRTDTIRRVKESDELIMNTVEKNAEAVAAQIEKVHKEECNPLFYNNEQSLRSVIKLAYFGYRDYFLKFEELPSGTGYADIVYFPKKDSGMPVFLIELKWNTDAEGAISQIKRRDYPAVLTDYDADILLVGISYDKDTKAHSCVIEEYRK